VEAHSFYALKSANLMTNLEQCRDGTGFFMIEHCSGAATTPKSSAAAVLLCDAAWYHCDGMQFHH